MAALIWARLIELLPSSKITAAKSSARAGFAGSVSGIPQLVKLIAGDAVARPAAAMSKAIMALLCLAFVALTVRSFVAARTGRAAALAKSQGIQDD